MSKYFSSSAKGFFDTDLAEYELPADAVEISREQHAELMVAQSNGATIQSDENGYPVAVFPPPKTLAEAQTEVWEKIKAERERRKAGGFKVDADGVFKWFHSDSDSRIQQIGLVMMGANMPQGLKWKTMDGSFVDMTPMLASDIFSVAAATEQAIFQVAEQHKALMLLEDDPSSYDYHNSWPKIYGEE